jgi:hypothetical protein
MQATSQSSQLLQQAAAHLQQQAAAQQQLQQAAAQQLQQVAAQLQSQTSDKSPTSVAGQFSAQHTLLSLQNSMLEPSRQAHLQLQHTIPPDLLQAPATRPVTEGMRGNQPGSAEQHARTDSASHSKPPSNHPLLLSISSAPFMRPDLARIQQVALPVGSRQIPLGDQSSAT